MINFISDYKKYKNSIVDLQTTNESFLRLASVYKKMGIENNVFHLTLLQPELQGVDPFSTELTQEQKVMITMECKYNPWYFLREVVRIPPQSGNTPVPYIANRGNIALTWCFFNHIDFALIQPRQTGKSVSTDCLMTNLIYLAMLSSRINMITKDANLRSANVERLKRIRDLLPPYLIVKDKTDANNQHLLTYNTLDNTYSTAVAQSSEAAAINVGRGTTAPITQIDEGPFIRFIGSLIPAALAAGTAAREEAERNNQPYGNIFTTTAGKKDDRDGKYMYDMISGGAVWNEVFLDAVNIKEFHRLVRMNCTNHKILVNGTFSHRQLGKSDDWLYRAISNANAKGEEADRDFFNRWTSGTQRSPLTTKQNNTIFESEREPDHTEVTDEGYMIRWYVPEYQINQRMATGRYVAGMDTSEGVGRDAITMLLMDVRDLSVVAAMDVNEANIIRFCKWVGSFLIAYENVTLVIERKSTGVVIIDALMIELPSVGIDPFKRLYNTIVQNRHERKTDYDRIVKDVRYRDESFYISHKTDFGFATNAQSRALLYGNVLQNAATNSGHLVKDTTLSTQLRGLVEKNGRIDHEASGNDDLVIAWLLASWFITYGNHLDFYGIDPGQCMMLVGEDTENISHSQAIKEKNTRTRERIDTVLEEITTTQSGFKLAKLEAELKQLTYKTKSDGGNILSFDALIKQANDRKKAKRSQTKNTRLSQDLSFW